MRRVALLALLLVLVVAAGVAWWFNERTNEAGAVVLHGNVDLRQVQLSFKKIDGIAEVMVHEGDRVHKAQALAQLETSRMQPRVAQAEAQTAAQRQVVQRLRNGNRPEEIAQARANVESARADAENARQ